MKHSNDLIFEIGTEELPTKAVKNLSESFTKTLSEQLDNYNLKYTSIKSFATPRRIAVLVKDLIDKQPDITGTKQGPNLKASIDKDGNYTKAAIGFAKSCGIEPDKLDKLETPKGSWLIYKYTEKGKKTLDLLQEIISNSIDKLPIPKPMRWSDHSFTFVRPVHWLLLIYGNTELTQGHHIQLFGLKSNSITFGHRFLSSGPIEIHTIKDYEIKLKKAFVIADFDTRKENIKQQIIKLADKNKLTALLDNDLLDEVTSLTEWPVALMGSFSDRFLNVPQECLITSMVVNQKYFALTDSNQKLQPNFIFISNIASNNKQQVINGNERVLSARLSDAEFFYNNDKKNKLSSNLDKLSKTTYQKKLGTMFDKTNKIIEVSKKIHTQLEEFQINNIDLNKLIRAAQLCKADLCCEVVFEFPELQGIMGKYYAQNDKEDELVAEAIEQHYLPKFSGDKLPDTYEACIVSLADKIDTIVGIFILQQKPTGEKDPFGLRRSALGILRILIEKQLPLDLLTVIDSSIDIYKQQLDSQNENKLMEFINTSKNTISTDIFDFCFERLKKYYTDQNISLNIFYSINNINIKSPHDFNLRINAVNNFIKLPESESLIAANKRVKNILNKQTEILASDTINADFLTIGPELDLYNILQEKNKKLDNNFDTKRYTNILEDLATLQIPINNFFDRVMVNSDDPNLKTNRLLLLKNIQNLFYKVADISELQQ